MAELPVPDLSLMPLEGQPRPTGAGGRVAVEAPKSEPFAWPTPPLAAYAPPVCQIDPEPCEYEPRQGEPRQAVLLSLDPVEGLLRLQLPAERHVTVLRLAQIRRLTLTRPLWPLVSAPQRRVPGDEAGEPVDALQQVLKHWPSVPYQLQLSSGESIQGQTVGHVELDWGLFLFPPLDAASGSVQRVLVPRGMVGRLDVGERLGQLLAGGEAERLRQIEDVARLQRALREQRIGEALVAQQVVTADQLLAALDQQARLPTLRLGEALVSLGALSDEQLQESLRQQRDERSQPLGELLLSRQLVTLEQVRHALARKMGYPVVDVSRFPVDAQAVQCLPLDAARRLGALPLMRRGLRLVVAVEDASRRSLLDELSRLTRCQIAPALSDGGDLAAAIESAYARANPLPVIRMLEVEPGRMPDLDLGAEALLTDPSTFAPTPAPAPAPAPEPLETAGLMIELEAAPAPAVDLGWPDLSGLSPGAATPSPVPPATPAPGAVPDAPAPPLVVPKAASSRRSARQAEAAAAPQASPVVVPAADAAAPTARAEARSDSPLIQLLAGLLAEAQQKGAQSLHFEPQLEPDLLQVRMRVRGQLELLRELPAVYRNTLPGRIKSLAELDVAETRRPQQGLLALGRVLPGQKAELPVATLPTQSGLEDLILTLPTRLKPLALEALGLSTRDLERWRLALDRPGGLLLTVGPPRSGRTTSLHAGLAHLNRPERMVCAIESRIELTQPGLRQIEINPRAGQDYEQALRAVMQADADVIMVADLSRPSVSRLALEAALDGRLVLGCLPARNTTEAVMRLIDQGLDAWNLSECLLGVHAQRLLNRLCNACRMSRPAKEQEVGEWLEGYLHGMPADDAAAMREQVLAGWVERFGREGRLRRFHSPGCERCKSSGLRGRQAVHEVMLVSRELRRLIRAGAPSWNLQRQAMKDGMRTLRQDAVDKMLGGLVSFDEVRGIADL